ncbi:MAG: RES family NAD+ phosphorylase [bacterium]
MSVARRTWRCFPWDPTAADNRPYSAPYLVPGQTTGRFDLHDRPPVRYLAETPEYAVGEVLGPFRGTTFHPSYLRLAGRPLALVEVMLDASLVARIPDCTDPSVLLRLGLRPDHLADHDRVLTQKVARTLHDSATAADGPAGLRWWSALTGGWHATVVFTDHERAGELVFGTPRLLTPTDPVLTRALSILGIRVR